MTIVSTMATTKNDRIYVRVKDEIKDEFQLVADYRGLTPSALLHSLIVKTIHEQRDVTPQIFTENKIADDDSLKEIDGGLQDQLPPRKISINAKPKNKTKKAKETFSTGNGDE